MTYRPHTDEDEYDQTYLGSGAAHFVRDPEHEEPPKPIARLYIPDPEQRSGWREWYIRPASRQSRHRPQRIGFRGPRV